MKHRIVYTDDLPPWVGGRCNYPLFPYFGLGTCIVEIRPKYKDDIGLLNHELKHVEQYSKDWFHVLKYKYSKGYRYKCELEAYKEQIKAYNYLSFKEYVWIVDAMFDKYNLDIDVRTITRDVKGIFLK